MNLLTSLSVSVIGGADGPTAIVVSAPGWGWLVGGIVALALMVDGVLWLRKRKK